MMRKMNELSKINGRVCVYINNDIQLKQDLRALLFCHQEQQAITTETGTRPGCNPMRYKIKASFLEVSDCSVT